MISLTGNSALIVPLYVKPFLNPVVVLGSPHQCAIWVVVLPEAVPLVVVVVVSPPQCAI